MCVVQAKKGRFNRNGKFLDVIGSSSMPHVKAMFAAYPKVRHPSLCIISSYKTLLILQPKFRSTQIEDWMTFILDSSSKSSQFILANFAATMYDSVYICVRCLERNWLRPCRMTGAPASTSLQWTPWVGTSTCSHTSTLTNSHNKLPVINW